MKNVSRVGQAFRFVFLSRFVRCYGYYPLWRQRREHVVEAGFFRGHAGMVYLKGVKNVGTRKYAVVIKWSVLLQVSQDDATGGFSKKIGPVSALSLQTLTLNPLVSVSEHYSGVQSYITIFNVVYCSPNFVFF